MMLTCFLLVKQAIFVQRTGLVVGMKDIAIPQRDFIVAREPPLMRCLLSLTSIKIISNDGSFCPNGYACVYCNAGSTKICCQGTNGVNIPPYVTQVTGSATPSIPATPSTQAAPTSHTAAAQTTSAPVYQYYTTTFTYSYIVWTDITYIENVVSSTITTTYTVLSCSATDDTAASTTLANLASQVEESASISAQNASPTAAVASQTSSLTSSLSVATAATGSKSEASTMIGRLCVSGTIAATAGVLIVILVI